MEYDIQVADTLIDLQDCVKDMMQDGWRPQGGMCVVFHAGLGRELYYQAMVKN